VSQAALVAERGATLLDALERHLPSSREHADATASYAFSIAAELGADRPGAEVVREAARLHEVGIVYLPEALLTRPRHLLDAEEAALVASHHANGARLAEGAAIPERPCRWIGTAGERFDGGGPLGMVGDEIPLEARIIRVACACDTLLAILPDRGPARADATIAQLRAAGGGELDPWVVEATSAVVGRATGSAS
jgi:HD-GYP domain-containing protein (c-di-GMP phosphodiesterase class II)